MIRGSASRVIPRSVIASKHFSYHSNIELVVNGFRSPEAPNVPSRVTTTPSVNIGQNEVLIIEWAKANCNRTKVHSAARCRAKPVMVVAGSPFWNIRDLE